MFKNILTTLAIALILVVTVVVTPSFAQNIQDGTGTYNEAPTTGTTTEEDNGFNPLWLLPLLAIPLFFMFKKDNRNDERSEYQDQGIAGMKGGRSERHQDDDLL